MLILFCYAEKGKTAEIAILGDSHGRHLLRGLFAGTSKGIVFLGMKGTPAIKNVFEVTAEPNYIKKDRDNLCSIRLSTRYLMIRRLKL